MSDEKPRRPWFRLRNIVLGVLLVVVFAVGWIAFDLWRVLVDMPEPDDPARHAMIEVVADAQPPGEDGWPRLARVLETLETAAEDARSSVGEPSDWDAIEAAELEGIRDAFADVSLLIEFRAALAAPRHVRPWSSDGLLFNELLPLAGTARRLGDVLARDAERDASRGDWPNAITRLEDLLRLGAVTGRQPTAIHALVGSELQRKGLRTIRRALHTAPPSSEAADALARLLESVEDPSIARSIELERLNAHNLIHWTHGSRGYALPLVTLLESQVIADGLVAMNLIDPANDDRTVGRAALARWFLATRAESIALIDAWYAAFDARAQQPYPSRWDGWPPPHLADQFSDLRFAVVATFTPNLERLVDLGDALIVERDATRLMVAIERYAAEHGGPPASLDALAPVWIDAVPTNVMVGGAFGYDVVPDDTTEVGDRRYRLFSGELVDARVVDANADVLPSYRTAEPTVMRFDG